MIIEFNGENVVIPYGKLDNELLVTALENDAEIMSEKEYNETYNKKAETVDDTDVPFTFGSEENGDTTKNNGVQYGRENESSYFVDEEGKRIKAGIQGNDGTRVSGLNGKETYADLSEEERNKVKSIIESNYSKTNNEEELNIFKSNFDSEESFIEWIYESVFDEYGMDSLNTLGYDVFGIINDINANNNFSNDGDIISSGRKEQIDNSINKLSNKSSEKTIENVYDNWRNINGETNRRTNTGSNENVSDNVRGGNTGTETVAEGVRGTKSESEVGYGQVVQGKNGKVKLDSGKEININEGSELIDNNNLSDTNKEIVRFLNSNKFTKAINFVKGLFKNTSGNAD